MIAACTTLDQMVNEMRLRFSLGFLAAAIKIDAQHRIDPADHLQIVAALATMPDPTRRPHEAKRIDQQECDSGNDKSEFQIALSSHLNLKFAA